VDILTEPPRQLRYVLVLPRWDVDWQPRLRRGRPVLDRKGKLARHRPVWDALRGNARPGHWGVRHRATREVASAVAAAARVSGLAGLRGHVTYLAAELVWAPGDHRRSDTANLAPLVKACVDALVAVGLISDDDDRHAAQTTRIDRPPARPGLRLEVTVTVGGHPTG
jgi:hypothetical protein